MNQTSLISDPDTSRETCQELLVLARHLDRFGRDTEQFLVRQLEQLERAVKEFESEKAAWRRQLRRESSQLDAQRAELERLRADANPRNPACGEPDALRNDKTALAASSAARKSGTAPIRLLLQPGTATPMQIGLLLFEFSKLNRDTGGRGIRFHVADIREPRRRFLTRPTDVPVADRILELTGLSTQPLVARGSHVDLDVDTTERIEQWIRFKTLLLQSSLVNEQLASGFRKSTPVADGDDSRDTIREATRRMEDAGFQEFDESGYSSAGLLARTAQNLVRQQMERLESCCERLREDTGLRIHVELHTADIMRLSPG
ncbi:MAG: hypothetical protein RIK87_28755 [Fuerstiella sp.]